MEQKALSQETLEALIGAGTGVTLFVWDESEVWPQVKYVSDNVGSVLGYGRDDFLDNRVNFKKLVHDDDLPQVLHEVGLLKSGATGYRVTHEDYRLRHRDGHYIWVSDTTVMRTDETTGETLLYGYLIDITQRKELEIQLETERNRLSLLLDATRLGTWEWNPQTGGTTFNERWANMFGYSLNEIDQHVTAWSSRLHPDDYQSAWAAVKAHLDGKTKFYESQHRILHRNGSWLYVLDRGRIIARDEHGKALRFAGTVTDVTEQKQAELDARRAAHAKNVFLANMSHEIRTPLHGILGLASVLENTDMNDSQKRLLGTIKNSGDYLLNTLNDLLDLTRAEEGQLRIKLGAFSVSSIFDHVRSLFMQRTDEKGIEFSVNVEKNLPTAVQTDQSRVIQIVSNLVNNAIKFTEQGFVRVDVRWIDTEQRAGELEVKVTDSGSGIRDTRRIWQLFEQEEDGLDKAQQGSGLGLAIVRNLVQLMNGTVQVDSEVGTGSCFTVCLPMAIYQGGMVEPTELTDEQLLPKLSPMNVLVVDDNTINQLIVKEMLTDLGQNISTCNSGDQALKRLTEEHFDAVFMDVHMPVMDGLETSRKIRQLNIPQPYIIALTANAFADTRNRALAAGINDYITKPFVKKDLANVLSRVTPLTQ